jgi:dihydrofolate reductase
MRLSLIVAATPTGIIGREGDLPWRLSSDLQRFKRLTMGHSLIMGRKTFDSIGKPLPGRTTIVITRDPETFRSSHSAGILAAKSIDEAIALSQSLPQGADTEPFIVGGGEVYRLAWPRADRVYCTWVLADIEGDVSIPPFPTDDWQLISSEEFGTDPKNEFPTRYCVYDRKSG